MHINNRLEKIASKSLNKVAMVHDGEEITYQKLLDNIGIFKNLLSECEIEKGDRVGILLPPDWPLAFTNIFFGALSMNAVVVPINPALKPEELVYILNDSECKFLVTISPFAYSLEKIFTHVPNVKYIGLIDRVIESKIDLTSGKLYELLNKAEAVIENNYFNPTNTPVPEDTAMIIYTSGTTGAAKGVIISHKNILANVDDLMQVLNDKDVKNESSLCILPLFHTLAITGCLIFSLFSGLTIYFIDKFIPSYLFKAIEKFKIGTFVGVPSIYRLMLALKKPEKYDYSSLKYCISGGAPLQKEIAELFYQKYKIPLLEGYGMTETSPVLSVNTLQDFKFGSVGKPLPSVEIKIIDDNGNKTCGNVPGNIFAKGPNVMKGYFKKPHDSEKILKDGWIDTGDIGYFDSVGRLYISGRSKDIIIVGGENIHPREIEEIINIYPGVIESAVIGIPDKGKGEVPIAFYATIENKDIDLKKLSLILKSKLADFKMPKKIIKLEILPRNPSGKILKRVIKHNYLQEN